MAETTTQNRAPRESSTRETSARPTMWRPPETLPMPDYRSGWAHRWVRISMMGEADPSNISSKLREGYEPCKAADYPELMTHASTNERFPGSVEIGGLLLCRIPEEFVKQRTEYYASQNKAQMDSVDNSFMRENDPRMPLFSERQSKVTFGNGS
ncbi:hypothetical protein [Pseudomonas sp.]|uniref:hypothetical protein n=1 Tax=Pseudomonas sp. TaxID=306 RepID=UPI00258CFC5D|nr:hypothetical protein [Pseudomonas sp.]